MQRRTFMDLTLGAAAALALKPCALGDEQERKSLVVYPDPAVEVLIPDSQSTRSATLRLNACTPARGGRKGPYGLRMGAISSSATSPTIAC